MPQHTARLRKRGRDGLYSYLNVYGMMRFHDKCKCLYGPSWHVIYHWNDSFIRELLDLGLWLVFKVSRTRTAFRVRLV